MRGRPEHRQEVTELLGRCDGIEERAGLEPGDVSRASSHWTVEELVDELRAGLAIEQLHRAGLAGGNADDRRQNAATVVAARNEIERRRAGPDRRREPLRGPGM